METECIDTFLDSPDDVCGWTEAPTVEGSSYPVQPRSMVFLARMAESGSSGGTAGIEGTG